MLKALVIVLAVAGLVIFTAFGLAPAQATPHDSQVYTWSFASLGNNQLVCKQILIHPTQQIISDNTQRQSIKMYSHSQVVEDRYCSHLTKPLLHQS